MCHHVELADTGEAYTCGEEESALHALARSGRRGIPVGCRGGGCGVCKVEVLAGEYRKKPMSRCHVSESDEAAHQVLACCIVPQSDLQLRVIGRMRKAWQAPAAAHAPAAALAPPAHTEAVSHTACIGIGRPAPRSLD